MGANDDRFLELAGLFLEGAAGAAELEALDRIVRDDAEARRTLAHLVDQHGTLRRLHAKPAAVPRSAPLRIVPRRRARVVAGIVAGAAAACLLGGLVAWLLLRDPGDAGREPAVPVSEVVKREPEPAPTRKPDPVPVEQEKEEAPEAVVVEVPKPPPEPDAPILAGEKPEPVVVRAEPREEKPSPEPPPPAPVEEPAVEEIPDSFTEHPGYKPPKDAPAERPVPRPVAPTVAAIALAKLERAEGEVFLLAGGGAVKRPAAAGKEIVRGAGLATGADGRAAVTYPDGTRLDLGPGSTVTIFSRWTPRGSEAGATGGKYLLLREGTLAAEVAAQPKGRPMILGTPLADVQVLGTRFTVDAGPDTTRVAVDEGRVVAVRRSDRRAAEVRAGQVLEVKDRGPLVAEAPPPPATVVATVRFGPTGTDVPENARLDSGGKFDAKRGFGWQGSAARRRSLVGLYRQRKWVTKGREPRAFAKAAGPMRASGVSAGSPYHAETWEFVLPPGRYLVTVCAGDADAAQGPHHVVIEGRPAIVATPTAAGGFAVREDVPVTVRDGRLTVAVGGHRSAVAPNPERPGETTLVYVVVKRVATRSD